MEENFQQVYTFLPKTLKKFIDFVQLKSIVDVHLIQMSSSTAANYCAYGKVILLASTCPKGCSASRKRNTILASMVTKAAHGTTVCLKTHMSMSFAVMDVHPNYILTCLLSLFLGACKTLLCGGLS